MLDLNINSPNGSSNGVGYSFSNQWTVSQAASIDGCLWYKTGTSPPPNKVYIVAEGNPTPLVTVGPAPVTWVDQLNGWWAYTFPSPVPVVSGTQYRITMYGESVGFIQSRFIGSPVPDLPFAVQRSHFQSGDHIQPATINNAGTYYCLSPFIGVASGGAPDPDPDPTAGTFHEAAIWLQYGNPNLRADSLAKLIYDYLGGLGDVIAQIDASTVNLPPLLATLTSTWLQARQADIAAILAQVDNLQAHVIGAGAGGGSAFYGPAGTQVAAGVEQLLAQAPGPDWAGGGVLAPSAHSLADTLPFGGQVGWGSGHALHRVHFDTTDARHPMIDLGAAGTWIPGIGWWAPILPDGSFGRRTPCEFQDQWLWPVPSAAVGLVLYVHPSVQGTLEAYAVPAVAP